MVPGTGPWEGLEWPKENRAGRRPFSESQVPPHPNDQFTGLAEGGMNADEMVRPTERERSASERTLAGNGGTQRAAMKPAMKIVRGVVCLRKCDLFGRIRKVIEYE